MLPVFKNLLPSSRALLPFEIGLFCILWSFAFVAGKVGVADCPPLLLLACRFLVAGLLILGIAALRPNRRIPSAREIAGAALLGIMNNALYLGLGYIGLQSISAGLGALIISVNPVLTAFLAAAFLGEELTWRKSAGLCLGVVGVAMVVAHRLSVGSDNLRGILFTLASLLALVAGTILFKRLAPKRSLWMANGIQNLAGGLVLAPVALAVSNIADIVPSARLAAAFAFMVLGASLLAFFLWFHVLDVCGATAASAFHFVMPPLGMLFAWLVLGEHMDMRDFLGIIPVAVGIYLVTRAKPEAAPAEALAFRDNS